MTRMLCDEAGQRRAFTDVLYPREFGWPAQRG